MFVVYALKLSPEIVVCNPGVYPAGFFYKLLRQDTKLILDIRSTPVEQYGIWSLLHQIYFRLVIKCSIYNTVSVITHAMLDELYDKYNLNKKFPTVVWKSGYDDELFYPIPNFTTTQYLPGLQGKFIIMFHGSLSLNRGLYEAMKGLEMLCERGITDIVLVFIGKGPAEPILKRYVKEKCLENHVVFLPPVSHEDIGKYLNCADLGMDPLPNHPWWNHQSPLKVYEYLAMGKPVIATDIPCHQGISNSVILIPHNSPEAIADAIQKYRCLPLEEKTALKETAVKDVQKHTWRARAQILSQFIKQEVLGETWRMD